MDFRLTYLHTRNLFKNNKFLPFVEKYFKDVKYLGVKSGNSYPSISISNWEEIKNKLPKYAIPIKVELQLRSVLDAKEHFELFTDQEVFKEWDNAKWICECPKVQEELFGNCNECHTEAPGGEIKPGSCDFTTFWE